MALACRAAVLQRDAGASTLRQISQRARDGGYDFSFATTNGIEQQQSLVVNPDTGEISVYGVYSYIDPATGRKYRVQYVADKNGFQPQGVHLVRSAGVQA